MSAPAQDPGSSTASLTTSSGAAIDPITGTIVETPSLSDMTEEEKEREMEKLFVLFNRLEKSGSLAPGNNPVRKAMERST